MPDELDDEIKRYTIAVHGGRLTVIVRKARRDALITFQAGHHEGAGDERTWVPGETTMTLIELRQSLPLIEAALEAAIAAVEDD